MQEQGLSADVGVVGAGPGGLAAAGHAVQSGLNAVVLERGMALAPTIHSFLPGKAIAGSPPDRILRIDVPLKSINTTREKFLSELTDYVARTGLDIRFNSTVDNIVYKPPFFEIHYNNSEIARVRNVIVAIGHGSPRKLEVPGADLPIVHYSLCNPPAFAGKVVAVLGDGNCAIEDALQLQRHGAKVHIFTRGSGFAKANQVERSLLQDKIDQELIWDFPCSSIIRIDGNDLEFNYAGCRGSLRCDAIIARLGYEEPLQFLDACNLRRGASLGDLGEAPGMPGLYFIGRLSGRPMIWQVMEQGVAVVEKILGKPVNRWDIRQSATTLCAADETPAPFELADLFGRHRLPADKLCDVLARCRLVRVPAGEVITKPGDYPTGFYAVGAGAVDLHGDRGRVTRIPAGEFFGVTEFLARPKRRHEVVAVAATSTVVLRWEEGQFLRMPEELKASLIAVLRSSAGSRRLAVMPARTLRPALAGAVASGPWISRVVDGMHRRLAGVRDMVKAPRVRTPSSPGKMSTAAGLVLEA